MNELLKCPDCELYFNTRGGLEKHRSDIRRKSAPIDPDSIRLTLTADPAPGMEFKEQSSPFPTDADGNAYIVQGSTALAKEYIPLSLRSKAEKLKAIQDDKAGAFARLKARVEAQGNYMERLQVMARDEDLRRDGDKVAEGIDNLVILLEEDQDEANRRKQAFPLGRGIPVGGVIEAFANQYKPPGVTVRNIDTGAVTIQPMFTQDKLLQDYSKYFRFDVALPKAAEDAFNESRVFAVDKEPDGSQ